MSTEDVAACPSDGQTSTISRPTPGRIIASQRWDHTTIEVDGLTLTPGEVVLVHAWPTSGRGGDRDVTQAIALTANTAEIRHPFGPPGRKVWVRRPAS